MSNFEAEIKMQKVADLSKKRRMECEGKTFKLVGVVNIIGVFPEFVMPVFVCEQDGKKYMQEGDEYTLTLNSFFEVESYALLKNVVYLNTVDKNEVTPTLYTINSKPVFAFQISNSAYFIGHADEMKEFLKNYDTENKVLKGIIEDFIKSC